MLTVFCVWHRSEQSTTGLQDTAIGERNKRKSGKVVEDRMVLQEYEEMLITFPTFGIFTDLYSEISFLAKYLRDLDIQDKGFGKLKLQDKYLENVSRNPFSMKIHDDFLKLDPILKTEIEERYPNVKNQFHYWVMVIIFQRIDKGESKPEWMQYVRESLTKYDFKKGYVMQNLGSDLHTTPADASADTDLSRDSLATRLDRLRDF